MCDDGIRARRCPSKRARPESRLSPSLSRDVLGLVLAALFPAMEDVFAALVVFSGEHCRKARRATNDFVLRVAMRTYFAPTDETTPLDPLLCRAWLWCQRAHKETLTPAEAICGFGLSMGECGALGAPRPLPVPGVVRTALGRSMAAHLPALSQLMLPKARVLAQASVSSIRGSFASPV